MLGRLRQNSLNTRKSLTQSLNVDAEIVVLSQCVVCSNDRRPSANQPVTDVCMYICMYVSK